MVGEVIVSAATEVLGRRVSTVIHGGARGVDTVAGYWAAERGYAVSVHLADWEGLGQRAGFVRNKTMVVACDAAIVVWDGESKGTAQTIELLKAARKPFVLVVLGEALPGSLGHPEWVDLQSPGDG